LEFVVVLAVESFACLTGQIQSLPTWKMGEGFVPPSVCLGSLQRALAVEEAVALEEALS
jgi:hypothetical protein